MTDQPAAPFDVADARKYANGPGAFMLLAACDRIEELHRAVKRVSEWCQEESARAEAAEARVKELEHFVRQTDLGDIRSRCQKAEASCAALVEALQYYASAAAWTSEAVEGNNGDYGKRARAVLASPDQAGAKLLDELERLRAKCKRATDHAVDLVTKLDERTRLKFQITEERDRLDACNEILHAALSKISKGLGSHSYQCADIADAAIRACDKVTTP